MTVPVLIVFLYWAGKTGKRWYDFDLRVYTSADLGLHKLGTLEARHMLQSAKVATRTDQNEVLERSGLRTVHLYINDGEQRKLDSNLPHSGRDYVEGGILNNGEVQKVDLRYRGDNVYHWGYFKKSWRIKTKRNQLFEKMRKFNLVAPRTAEAINNYLAIKLATEMGLITPRIELVNLAINGEVQGIYILTEQLEESTLRAHDRMPGDLYSGELVGLDSYSGVENDLFDSTGFWSKAAINNHMPEDSLAPLGLLLDSLNPLKEFDEGQHELTSLLDIQEFAQFNVLESVVGTVHVDDLHNWRLYYDPWWTLFSPIVWDLVGWHRSVRLRPGVPFRPDVISSRVHVALHQNGEFLRAKHLAFREFFERGLDQYLINELDSATHSIATLAQIDPNMVEEGIPL
ncbi:MAG: CotH kinase family protein [Planctomycetota bacterium]